MSGWIHSADGVDMSEPADRILTVAEEHYKRVEAERDALRAQVAELRSALQDGINRWLRNQCFPIDSWNHILSAANPGAEFLAKAKRAEELYADSMVAHRWFATHFGEVMNGRDFDVKCSMATDILLAKLDRLEALEKFVRSQPCHCQLICRSCIQGFWKILYNPSFNKCCASPEMVECKCERCKALGE